jgi:hypothetical protein
VWNFIVTFEALWRVQETADIRKPAKGTNAPFLLRQRLREEIK